MAKIIKNKIYVRLLNQRLFTNVCMKLNFHHKKNTSYIVIYDVFFLINSNFISNIRVDLRRLLKFVVLRKRPLFTLKFDT